MAPIPLNPLGTGADDWPRLKALADLYAYKRPIELGAGLWICRSKQQLPSGTTIIGGSGVRIKQELTFTGTDPFNAAFSAGPKFAAQPKAGRILAFPFAWDNQITCDTAFEVGEIVRIWRGNHGLLTHYYTVKAIEGTGPYALELDRRLGAQFRDGDLVQAVASVPKDIKIYGHGMQISGTGDRYLELAAAVNCTVSMLSADTLHGGLNQLSPAMSLDIGCYDSAFINCRVESKAFPINSGIIIESGYGCKIYDCEAQHTGGIGLGLMDCYRCLINCGGATGCNQGGYIGLDGTGEGCRSCEIDEGHYSQCVHGIHIGGSYNSKISNVECANNDIGIKISTGEKSSRIDNATLVANKQQLLIHSDCECDLDNSRLLP